MSARSSPPGGRSLSSGLGLALSNWLSLLVLAALPAVGLLIRIRSEERALFAALGDDHGRFAATHRRLFPGIW